MNPKQFGKHETRPQERVVEPGEERVEQQALTTDLPTEPPTELLVEAELDRAAQEVAAQEVAAPVAELAQVHAARDRVVPSMFVLNSPSWRLAYATSAVKPVICVAIVRRLPTAALDLVTPSFRLAPRCAAVHSVVTR